jgi:hypothetical protein
MTADVYHADTGKPHPARPKPRRGQDSGRYRVLRARLEAQRARQTRAAASVADPEEASPIT